ncbi:MAG: hypothetical protein LAKADJCE_00927 [Candidatus Argoarchaeum ethanivorans]|uniref:Uncharacterized protein n=1 Tax=Candidatus Argoarchaeum ethanivorans TaxID=2608793 RepID=A0A811TE80_9EURY|nr:MAG: hypothetical protein LAKADJCE_00927 [Candidatus Argoarchaeum ethanivorans]
MSKEHVPTSNTETKNLHNTDKNNPSALGWAVVLDKDSKDSLRQCFHLFTSM